MPAYDKTNDVPIETGAYVLKFSPSNSEYYGSAKNLRARKGGHLNALARGDHPNKDVQKEYDNGNILEFKILSITKTREDAYLKEQEYLNAVKENNNVLNKAFDAKKPFIDLVMTDEIKEKIRQSRLGNTASQETKDKMSLTRTGKKQSPETIEKSRLARLGRKSSDEALENIREGALLRSKKVIVNGIEYSGIRKAARELNTSIYFIHKLSKET